MSSAIFETEQKARKSSPEAKMWAAVLTLAIADAYASRGKEADEARHFLLGCNGRWFEQVCDMAGINPDWIRRKIDESVDDPNKVARIIDMGKRIQRKRR